MTTTENPRARLAPMMTAARGIATDATMEISPATLEAIVMRLPSTGDPVDDLVARVRPRAGEAVDSLQIAAMLEADGLNDRAARVEYGYTDVFDLADEVYRRMGGTVPRLRPIVEHRDPGRAWREVSHGLLYLLPSALFPAVVAVVLPHPLVVALVVAGALGWVWAGGSTWLAYQWLNVHEARGAGRVLAWASAIGVAVAALTGVGVAFATGGGYTAAVLVPGVMAYQMASTLLLFYRRELWLAALMVPAAAAGVAYVVLGRPMLRWALVAVSACVLAALAIGLHQAWHAGTGQPKPATGGLRARLRGRTGMFLSVLGYTALSAAFLLHAQAPYLLTHLDVVLACAPLIVAMGVVEWRARHFVERSRRLLGQVRYPNEFARRVWLLLAANVAVCWLAVAVVAAAVLGALRYAGWLSPAGIAMAAAQVALAGAYFLGFILAGHQRYGWLCGALAASILVHVVTARLVTATTGSPETDAYIDMALYFGSAVLLQALLVAALAPVLGQARRYR